MRYLRQALHRRLYKQRYGLLHQLLQNEELSSEQLLAKRARDLNAIVTHAMANTPFYREKYRGIAPGNDGFAITALPKLHKSEVAVQRDAMVDQSCDRSKLKVAHTSGSTGVPLSYYYDDAKHVLMRAGMMRSYMWSGWRPGQRILNFWGARQDIKAQTAGQRIESWIAGERTIGAHQVSDARLALWASAVRDYRPVLLQGYASILAALAEYVIEHRLAMPRTLLGVYSTAELLFDSQRALMERAFGCKVFNQYGCREVPNIAVECRHGNQHVFTDMVYLESLLEQGEERLLVTSLTNRTMPFIRYELGDVGRLKDGVCSCGSPFPLMEMGQCRQNDHIRTRSGKHIHPSYFHHLLDGFAGVRQYRFVQTALDTIVLDVAAAAPLPTTVQEQLQQRIRAEVDPGTHLLINHRAEIARSASGKHRFVICEIQ